MNLFYMIFGQETHETPTEIIDVKLEHVLALGKLPSHHQDPFDRLLIAQADIEGAILVSNIAAT